ncbi:hypothetical protein LTR10_011794 [Elasticomyces elasticus]|uniref:Transcription factor domain-containing protein n=1 Tax=Exophiala sideris TaxID=1016849 RepID=A0ABR0JDS0_9EURO|nr:hypothetical protein LTR10_011794 [Elasticomyces elasticus]KAK5031749.1 hypothetical protein LTS07_004369 [Exophiala sideris]KAK5040678.1 hypothetical protein LTR13_002978 [Exophiala sideris]KAK5061988.1 hypothetical protein LTR69_005172 [Exophiala sideris]KAK5184688.1 hypothetical protein LTR44_003363 [Eurotiomycetes sp. CCFEE 6388]
MSFFHGLVDDYESFVFSFLPILTKEELLEAIAAMHISRETCALVHAIAAITFNMRHWPLETYETVRDQVLFLITRALEIRGALMPLHGVTMQTVMTSVCVHVCLLAHHVDDDMAFIYLREAVAGMQILGTKGLEELPAHSQLSQNSAAQRQRLHWLLFIHERYAAIADFRPPVLPPLSSLPDPDEALGAGVHQWYIGIIQRFSMLDGTFIANWTTKDSHPPADIAWIEEKQAQLSQCMDLSGQQRRLLTEMQQADLVVTSYWLRTLLWQIALSKFLLTTETSSESMSIFFPLRLSRQLQWLLMTISRDAIEIHGAGILRKIFDITNTVADILIQVTPSTLTRDTEERIDDFIFLYDYLNTMSRFHDAEKRILREKRERIDVLFPREGMAESDLQRSRTRNSEF